MIQNNVVLSGELKRKLFNELPQNISTYVDTFDMLSMKDGYRITQPIRMNVSASLTFSDDEQHLFKECISWYYKCRRVNVGRIKNILPTHVILHKKEVRFEISHFESESWKDWLIPDEEK